jgi:hypothetical protein
VNRRLFGAACVLAGLLVVGCEKHVRLKTTAQALARGADECLSDVRDRRLTYETSRNCAALGALAMQYIEAGGFHDQNPSEHALIAERARTTAWTARATSLAGGRPLSIW